MIPAVSTVPPQGAIPSVSNGVQLAQAAAPESFPACTYDPPLPPPAPVIRGLW
jgi:hypothetical protein